MISPHSKTQIDKTLASIGKPYIWQSAGPRGFDCLGIVRYIHNLGLPESVRGCYPESSKDTARAIKRSLETGELYECKTGRILLMGGEDGDFDHLGAVIGDMVIHCPIDGFVRSASLKAISKLNVLRVEATF